eukprot:CAMPEP_0118675648 /NCGR_PEP_ID=MMETSP0800-20121206/1577_1 /TAXON_ID=210618 ORGANISM="Striatella unipunctata, Strain CCMP2910" /NCGR_SAMPLE_ID=MMETSP0800 /ASSEMBLY_ACC=CAM_ASM_000638 /LENGTH=367 /DNA_ID=CAMNT_0006571011 /DNA_START=78 /DNA_END=1181 /DNA_ORIENTATION=-
MNNDSSNYYKLHNNNNKTDNTPRVVRSRNRLNNSNKKKKTRPPPPAPPVTRKTKTTSQHDYRMQVMPKVVQLAEKLVPAVAAEMERDPQSFSTSTTAQVMTPTKERLSYKTTGLTNEDGGSSSSTNNIMLPQGAAQALGINLTPVAAPRRVVSVASIASELRSDMALLDSEADAIMASIRQDEERTKKVSPPTSSNAPFDLSQYESDMEDDESAFLIEDDDGYIGEQRNIHHSLDALTRDLAHASLEDLLAQDADDDDEEEEILPSIDDDTMGQLEQDTMGQLEHDETHQMNRGIDYGSDDVTGNFIKTYKLYGPGVGGQDPNWPLYFSVALIWAILILLAGRVSFGTVHDLDDGIQDVFAWLFGGL